jgi:hypothetical protein
VRRGLLATTACAGALALAACGDTGGETTVNAKGEDADIAEAIQAELDLYREPIDISILPPDQQAQVGEAIDQFPQAAGTVAELTVTDGIVEARTGLEPGGDSETTATLICGAIIRGGGERRGAHVVIGSGGETIAECSPGDASYP